MVKEGSLPLAKAVYIFIDLCAETSDAADLLVQGVYSVSMQLMEQGVPQYYIWFDNKNDLIQEQLIENEEELFWMFEDLFKCRTTKEPDELIHAYMEWEEGRQKETGLYLTVTDHTVSDLDELGVTELQVLDLRDE